MEGKLIGGWNWDKKDKFRVMNRVSVEMDTYSTGSSTNTSNSEFR